MDNYLKTFREMISPRGLTEHTVVSYSTYIIAYLDYLSAFLHKTLEDVSWHEMRDSSAGSRIADTFPTAQSTVVFLS